MINKINKFWEKFMTSYAKLNNLTIINNNQKSSKYFKYKFLFQSWAIGLAFSFVTCAAVILFKIALLAIFLRSKVKEIFDFNLLKSFITMSLFVLLTWTLYKVYLYGVLEHNTNIDQGLESYKSIERKAFLNDIIKNKDLINNNENIEDISNLLKNWKDTEISEETSLSHITTLRKLHQEGILDIVTILETAKEIINGTYKTPDKTDKQLIDPKIKSFNEYFYYTGPDFQFKDWHLKYFMSVALCTIANDNPEKYQKLFKHKSESEKLLKLFHNDEFFETWARKDKSPNSVVEKAKREHDGLSGQHGALYFKKEYNKDKRTLLITVTFAAVLMSLNKFEEIICNKFNFAHSLSGTSIAQHITLTAIKLIASLAIVLIMFALFVKYLEKPLDKIVAKYQTADFDYLTSNREEVFSYTERHNRLFDRRAPEKIEKIKEAFNPIYQLLVPGKLLTKENLEKEDHEKIKEINNHLALDPKSMLEDNVWEVMIGRGGAIEKAI